MKDGTTPAVLAAYEYKNSAGSPEKKKLFLDILIILVKSGASLEAYLRGCVALVYYLDQKALDILNKVEKEHPSSTRESKETKPNPSPTTINSGTKILCKKEESHSK